MSKFMDFSFFLFLCLTFFSSSRLAYGQDGIPVAAQDAGYSVNTFSSDFAGDIDVNNTKFRTYNWYRAKFFGWPPTSRNAISYIFPSGVRLNISSKDRALRGITSNYTLASAAPGVKKKKKWVGKAFGGGGYFEAELKFDPSAVSAEGTVGFPAWWLEPIEHLIGTSQWPGQPKGYVHFVEIDIFEYKKPHKRPHDTYLATLHEWYGLYKQTCLPQFCKVSNTKNKTQFNNNVITVPEGTDFSQFHKYGMLWVPASKNSKGFIKFYFDGKVVSTIDWVSFDGSPPPPGKQPWTFGVLDNLHYVLILGTGVQQPMVVRSVNAWQKSNASNLVQ